MLWAIKDNRDYYGPYIDVVRADTREDAVRIWVESKSEHIALNKSDDAWHAKFPQDEDYEPLPLESSLCKELVKYTAGDTYEVQIIPLDPEGDAGMLVDRELPLPPPRPKPKQKPIVLPVPRMFVRGEGHLHNTRPDGMTRLVCNNTLAQALGYKR